MTVLDCESFILGRISIPVIFWNQSLKRKKAWMLAYFKSAIFKILSVGSFEKVKPSDIEKSAGQPTTFMFLLPNMQNISIKNIPLMQGRYQKFNILSRYYWIPFFMCEPQISTEKTIAKLHIQGDLLVWLLYFLSSILNMSRNVSFWIFLLKVDLKVNMHRRFR